MSKDSSGAAFPTTYDTKFGVEGLSKREHFAGLAMQGYLAAPGENGEAARENADKCAEWSLVQADALLKKLAEESLGG